MIVLTIILMMLATVYVLQFIVASWFLVDDYYFIPNLLKYYELKKTKENKIKVILYSYIPFYPIMYAIISTIKSGIENVKNQLEDN